MSDQVGIIRIFTRSAEPQPLGFQPVIQHSPMLPGDP